jgi:3-hydroxyisobutyrate dehydrogenase-like beta-hydroxyacid dehydrogenase
MAAKGKRIGFIGVGMMGHGMAKNLLLKGFEVAVLGHRNRAPVEDLLRLGAREARSPADSARGADIVFICVTGSPEVENLALLPDGLLKGARKGLYVVDCSTSEPDSTARLRALFAAKGAHFIDAPLTRTPKEAEEGRLNTMVGAEPEEFAAIRPALAAFAENIFHVGPPGAGHKLKLVNNFLAMGVAALTAEAYTAAAKVGVDLAEFHRVVSVGAVNNGIFQMMVGGALKGDFAGMKFAIANARKDLRYYTHMAETAPVAGYLAEAVHQTLIQATALGYGDRLVPSLIEAAAQVNGVKLGGKRRARKG